MCHPTCTTTLFTGLYSSLTQVSNSLNGLVVVIVGPQKQVFPLHKEILCAVSSYFRSALEGSFVEGLTQKIELPEDDVTVFKYFRVWLYSSIIQDSLPSASQAEDESESESESKPDTDIGWKILLDLYIFADMRDIPLLQNATMDAIIWKSDLASTFISDLIHYVYDRTAAKSPLRKLLVDLWVSWSNPTWFDEKYYGLYSKRFLFDAALAKSKLGLRGSKKVDDFWAARTDYYVEPSEDVRKPVEDELVEWLRDSEGATGVIGIPD